LSHRATALET